MMCRPAWPNERYLVMRGVDSMREEKAAKAKTIAISVPIIAATAACWTTAWVMVFWLAYRLVN